MTWVGDLDCTKVTVGIEEGVVVVFRIVVKGKPGSGNRGN